MAKANYIKFSNDVLKLDKSELNKQVLYPIIAKGYNIAKIAAITQRKTGQLVKNLKTVSLNKRNNNTVGYILYAGRRSDYTDNTPHFVTFYKYNNGKVYRAIKKTIRSEVNKLK
ncbi:MAG: hypothetical protein EOM50_11445 [Erysipelotrichia bacterium]|nr:hypothetical protein [Erysipelotrichia bacterium]